MKKVLIHGSGHKADSWNKTILYLENFENLLCPNLFSILEGKEANYTNLYSSFADYCNEVGEPLYLCGLSLGGLLALNYTLDFPEKVESLVLIGTPYKIPKTAFAIQNAIFRFLPNSVFQKMAFDKNDTFTLTNSMKNIDFSSRLQNIKCPTLILCGQKDRANRKSAYQLSQAIENATLKIIEKTGHVVNEENPRELAKLLDEWFPTPI